MNVPSHKSGIRSSKFAVDILRLFPDLSYANPCLLGCKGWKSGASPFGSKLWRVQVDCKGGGRASALLIAIRL